MTVSYDNEVGVFLYQRGCTQSQTPDVNTSATVRVVGNNFYISPRIVCIHSF